MYTKNRQSRRNRQISVLIWLRREPAPHKLHSYFQRAMWRAHAHIHACTQVNKNNKKKFKKELYGAGTKVDRYLNRLRNSEINPQSVSTFFKKKRGGQNHTFDERQTLQQMVLGNSGVCMEKNETRSVSLTSHKNPFKTDQRP